MSEVTQAMELAVLEPVEGIGVTEVATRLQLNKAKAYRVLQALVEAGWLEQTASSTYVPSVAFGRLAERIRQGYLGRMDMIHRRLEELDGVDIGGPQRAQRTQRETEGTTAAGAEEAAAADGRG